MYKLVYIKPDLTKEQILQSKSRQQELAAAKTTLKNNNIQWHREKLVFSDSKEPIKLPVNGDSTGCLEAKRQVISQQAEYTQEDSAQQFQQFSQQTNKPVTAEESKSSMNNNATS